MTTRTRTNRSKAGYLPKTSLAARKKFGMKDMAITMRMSTNASDYEEEPNFLKLNPREVTRRFAEGYSLYFPRQPWIDLINAARREENNFHLIFDPCATDEDVKYGFLGTYLGIGLVTDGFCAPHRRLQAGLYPDKVYWTKVAPSKY